MAINIYVVERFLVQYITQAGVWLDACMITGCTAIFDVEDAANEFVKQQNIENGSIRVVRLLGEVC
jgi:dihydroxyacid dehydratase/phosphogluconate dehydratase